MADDSKRAQDLAEEKALLDDLTFANEKAAIEVRKLVAAEKLLAAARRTNADNTAELEANVKKLNEGLSAVEKEINQQRLAVAKAEKSLELYNKRVDALASSAEGAAGAMDKMFGTNMSSYIDRTKTFGISLSGLAGAYADYAKQLDSVGVDLARTTGFGSALNDVFDDAQQKVALFGVGMEQLGKVMGTLSTEYSRFNALSKKQQKELTVQTAFMEQLGVSADLTAQTYEALSYAFGVTDSALADATNNMDKFAMSIGTVPAKVLEDLTALAPTLARFGASGISVFKNLAREARQLGLTTQAAFDLSELFDTFESSANAAGRLNAQFGLQLNSVELMTANSDERLDMLRQEFELQGKSYDLMGRREKQMIADILGVDELTAGKVLGSKMDTSKLQKETTRDNKLFKTMAEVGTALKEAQFSEQNKNIRAMNYKVKEAADALISQPEKLNSMVNLLIGISSILTAMQLAQIARGLMNIKNSRGPMGPSGTGSKVKFKRNADAPLPSNLKRSTRKMPGSMIPMAQVGKVSTKASATAASAAASGGGGFFSRMAGKAKGIAGKAGVKGGGILAKIGSKGIIQGIKKIPILGALPSAGMAISRAMEGDFMGAAMEVGSAAANLSNIVAPGIGTAAALAIDGAIMARDMGVIMNKDGASPKAPPGMGKMSKMVRAGQSAKAATQTINIGEQKHVIKIGEKEIVDITTPAVVKHIQPATP